ncbi:hypothetical protein LSCM1_08097 [Leishmania martiniquensis]|uniref:Uncharacterized protein n=1 Tax=Leishmania martiniquensis TaxID=1580590 RepID=A0A836KVY5_9TRYP|nr:hypothetical protein LSCM1_08097 [Leishmania martiniquensis]
MTRIVRLAAPLLHCARVGHEQATLPCTPLSHAGTWDSSHLRGLSHPLQRIPAGRKPLSRLGGTITQDGARFTGHGRCRRVPAGVPVRPRGIPHAQRRPSSPSPEKRSRTAGAAVCRAPSAPSQRT